MPLLSSTISTIANGTAPLEHGHQERCLPGTVPNYR